MSGPTDDPKEDTTECLHCEINDLVQQRIQQGGADLAELAAMLVESLADLVLLAPEENQATLMAETLAHFGQVFLERNGTLSAEPSGATH